MRVLFINRTDADERPGGDTVQMHETVRALRALGVEIEEHLGPASTEQMSQFDIVHLFNLQTPFFTAPEAVKAKEAGKKLAVSTIYWDFAAEIRLATSPHWMRMQKLVGRKIALSIARWRAKAAAPEERKCMQQILGLADVLLPNSHLEIDRLRHITPNLGAVQVVPNAIDAARFDPSRSYPLPAWAASRGIASKGYVLIAARVEQDKNQLAFCRATQSLGKPIVLAGQAIDAEIARQCEAMGAICVGPLRGEDMVAAYAHARVHALPSFRETPGLASLEAAAMGCAIVSTNWGSASEYLGEDAQYCSPGSQESMRSALESAWNAGPPPSLSERIRREYTWNSAAQATLKAYESSVG